MTTATHDSTLEVETRTDRLIALRGTVLRCIGALSGDTDSTSRLVCEALQQVTVELTEMIHESSIRPANPPAGRYRDMVD